MATLERSRPIQAIRSRPLGARRGACNTEQAERRQGGDAAKETAARCNIGLVLIEIAHPISPSHTIADDPPMIHEIGQGVLCRRKELDNDGLVHTPAAECAN